MRQKLFTKQVDDMLFKQYPLGNDLSKQKVVAKIFNPYGLGTWYLINSDPNDSDYLWAIVDLFEVEVGSVSREDLQTIKVPPFGLNLERDMYFQPINAQELLSRLRQGEKFADGGMMAKGVETDYYKDFDFNKDGELSSTIDGKTYLIKYRDDVSQMYDLFENDKKIKSSLSVRELMKFDDGGMMGVSGEMDGEWVANTGAGMFAKGGNTQGYEIYHNTLASALREVEDYLHSEGYLFTSDKYFPDVTIGGIKYGETKRFTRPIKLQGKSKEGEVNIQIYRMDSGNYELNMYPSYAKGGATDVELVEKEGEAYLTSTGDSKKRMAIKLAKGGYMAKGGMTKKKSTFADKVKSIKATLLKRKKVSPKVQKDYGKTYSPKEAEDSAKRIAGSMRKKEMSKKKS